MSFIYRGLEAEYIRHTVTDEEIDRQIERLQQQNPRIAVIKDRPTEQGDEIVLDYAGYCNGVQFAGGTAQNQTLILGSGMFIPGFEEQLLDKVPEEKVTVKVRFPEEYHAAELAGKEAEFHCVIHEIRVKTTYDLDDVFAKEVGRCETFAEMREKLGESLQAFTDERGELDLQDRLLRQAAATLELEISEKEIDAAVEAQIQDLTAQLAQQGLTLDMYCQFTKNTEATLREDARPAAEQNIRINATVEEIARREGIEATDAEIEESLQQICRQNNMTREELQPYIDGEFEVAVIRSILTRKVMRFVRDAATVIEK